MNRYTRCRSAIGVITVCVSIAGCAASSTPATASECLIDRARESRLEQETTATLFDGTPVRIRLNKPSAQSAKDFLGIWSPGAAAKPVIVLAHGPDRNAGSTVITETALALAELGYGTLILQLPVMQKNCENSKTYPQTFPEAMVRIDSAAAWLQSKGVKEMALFGHWIANVYFDQTDNAPFLHWIVNGLTGNFRSVGNNSQLRILDVYGSQGNSMTLRTTWLRRLWMLMLGKDGKQVEIEGADHNFTGKTTELAKVIDQFLSKQGAGR